MRFSTNLILQLLIVNASCHAQLDTKKDSFVVDKVNRYLETYEENNDKSNSKGTVGNGTLENGKLVPFSGPNFNYFDSTSYVSSRAFVNDKVRTAMLNIYKQLQITSPERHFCIMECSHEHGGKLSPHRTHQNGLSLDFMTPLLKDGVPYYGMDNLGAQHYLLDFDENGKYTKDPSIAIDFDAMALHILTLNEEAKKIGLEIEKVLFKIELKDELYCKPKGRALYDCGIYFAQKLTPLINGLHDDHYHVDFKLIPCFATF